MFKNGQAIIFCWYLRFRLCFLAINKFCVHYCEIHEVQKIKKGPIMLFYYLFHLIVKCSKSSIVKWKKKDYTTFWKVLKIPLNWWVFFILLTVYMLVSILNQDISIHGQCFPFQKGNQLVDQWLVRNINNCYLTLLIVWYLHK